MLREMRGHHGGPRLGIRVLALALALLLAAPLTILIWQFGTKVVHAFL